MSVLSYIKQCQAPCQGYISKEEYKKNIDGAVQFLNGNYKNVLFDLEQKMYQASEEMNFEDAAGYWDLIQSVKQIGERQKITEVTGKTKISSRWLWTEDGIVQVFFVREGKFIEETIFM